MRIAFFFSILFAFFFLSVAAGSRTCSITSKIGWQLRRCGGGNSPPGGGNPPSQPPPGGGNPPSQSPLLQSEVARHKIGAIKHASDYQYHSDMANYLSDPKHPADPDLEAEKNMHIGQAWHHQKAFDKDHKWLTERGHDVPSNAIRQ